MWYSIKMGNDNRAMFERITKLYAESATEWQLKLIVWEFFCTLTWSGRARNCVRKRRTHVTRWLRYWARTARPSVADPLEQLAFVIRWERGEIGQLPHCHILIARFPERSLIRARVSRSMGAALQPAEDVHSERDYLADARAWASGSPPGVSPLARACFRRSCAN
jgi:hypothetical protein